MGGETAGRAFLYGQQDFVPGGQAADQVFVQRLGEARIGDGGGKPHRRQFLGRLQGFAQARAEAEDGYRQAFAEHPALADLQHLAPGRQLNADPFAARIADRRRLVIDGHRGGYHVHQFRLVGRRHDHETRQRAQVRQVEGTAVGASVGADITGAVDGEADGQALNGDVVHNLIVGALQERRINHRERLVPLARQPSGEGHPMLFGDADVKAAFREALGELVDPGAVRHGGGDGDDLVVHLGLGDQALGKDAGKAAGVGF